MSDPDLKKKQEKNKLVITKQMKMMKNELNKVHPPKKKKRKKKKFEPAGDRTRYLSHAKQTIYL